MKLLDSCKVLQIFYPRISPSINQIPVLDLPVSSFLSSPRFGCQSTLCQMSTQGTIQHLRFTPCSGFPDLCTLCTGLSTDFRFIHRGFPPFLQNIGSFTPFSSLVHFFIHNLCISHVYIFRIMHNTRYGI